MKIEKSVKYEIALSGNELKVLGYVLATAENNDLVRDACSQPDVAEKIVKEICNYARGL